MIHPHDQSGGEAPSASQLHEITFEIPKALKFTPCGNNILLGYKKPEKAGTIHLPTQAKQLDTIICDVLAVGPECKFVKVGQRVLILTKALVGGPEGLTVEGRKVFFTQEQVLISVVENALPSSAPVEP